MAKGKKTGGRDFGPNNPPPKSPGRRPMSKEARMLKELTADEYVRRVNKYLFMTKEEIQRGIDRKDIEALDLFIRNNIIKGIEAGDQNTLEKMLDRLIGRVGVDMKMRLTGKVNANLEGSKTEVVISDAALAALGAAIARATGEDKP